MKQVAVLILVVIMSAFILQPITEFGLVLTEKIQLESTLGNALRVANADSLVYTDMRNLDAVVDQVVFFSSFGDVFESGMNVTHITTTGNIMSFTSNDGTSNPIFVEIIFVEDTDIFTNRVTTTVEVEAKTNYKLKTSYLKTASSQGEAVDYELVGNKTHIISIVN